VLNKAKQWKILKTDLPAIKLFRINNSRTRYLTKEEYHKILELSPMFLQDIIMLAVNRLKNSQ